VKTRQKNKKEKKEGSVSGKKKDNVFGKKKAQRIQEKTSFYS